MEVTYTLDKNGKLITNYQSSEDKDSDPIPNQEEDDGTVEYDTDPEMVYTPSTVLSDPTFVLCVKNDNPFLSSSLLALVPIFSRSAMTFEFD